jgi:hypothetical protein
VNLEVISGCDGQVKVIRVPCKDVEDCEEIQYQPLLNHYSWVLDVTRACHSQCDSTYLSAFPWC